MNRKTSHNIAGRVLAMLLLLGTLLGLVQVNLPAILGGGAVPAVYADGCDGSVPPQPDPTGLCGPTPTPTPWIH